MMGTGVSALYAGRVMHHRVKPRRHRLSYRIFSLLIDLDKWEQGTGLRLLSRNRWNVFSVYDRDYTDRSGKSLKPQIERIMLEAGIEPDGGSVRLLTMPRILGYAFNPLSVFFCYRRCGRLAAMVYEVHNTFGERHSYVIPAGDVHDGLIHQKAMKRFFVSPFMNMDLAYAFRVRPPGERLQIAILVSDDEGPVLSACHTAERRPLTDAALARAFVLYPLLTFKVIVGIHWEALLLWGKGLPLMRKPAPPARPVTAAAHRS